MAPLSRGTSLAVNRLPLLGLAAIALLAGLTGSLVLLGFGLPTPTLRLAGAHGVLMSLGFLGTLIALERAVALRRAWGYAAPLAAGLGAGALVLGLPVALGAALIALGGAVFVAMYVAFERIEATLHTRVQAAGAIAWLGAALLWLAGRPVSSVTPWLAAFLVLTIAGERLELSRLGGVSPRARSAFVAAAAVFGAGVVLSVVASDAGVRLAGVGLLALAAWFARNDLARRTVHAKGVTRFIAVCLLAGYAWLALAGATWLLFGSAASGAIYDVRLHALFLGFVMSMVFGHAPVILPAVLRLPLPYHPRFYLHVGLLHAGLALRIVGGDMLGSTAAWQAGGVVNVLALLVFLGSSAGAAVGALRDGRGRAATPSGRRVDRHVEVAVERERVDDDPVAAPREPERRARLADAKPMELHAVEERRE